MFVQIKKHKKLNNSNKNPITGFDYINAKLKKKDVLKQSLALLSQKMTLYTFRMVYVFQESYKNSKKTNIFKCVIKIRRTRAVKHMIN